MSSLQALQRKIRTVACPYHEMLCSLHVLHQPEHHPRRLHWAGLMLSTMPLSLIEGIHTIGRLSDSWLGLTLTLKQGTFASSQEGILQLKLLPDAELICLLLAGKFTLGTILAWLQQPELAANSGTREWNGPGKAPDEAARYLLRHLESVRTQLFTTLEQYEQNYFRKEWEYIQPWMSTAATGFQDTVSRSAEKALNLLHPRLHAAEGTITAQKAHTYYFRHDQLQLIYVLPSTFIFPHLLMDWTTDSLMLPLAVDIPGQPVSEDPPEDLLRSFKALGDATRLRMLKLLYQSPHCTKQLAPVLGISEAAVSKQLKLLSAAGLVQAERKGNYLFYSTDKEAFDSLIILQRQYFDQ
ncbi:metalloregulator ArsR/SmtB family transcription factor [Paenibacillus sp. MMS20-IR301]|uniref:ArsR/SmtB family transcription factor n=1 Tax=Paenibacillus sp. MMS20-IR301 TaxID=2895946 RepID=UPI0028ECB044|nr:metalloregulator ArsR/SmtB family transcription factor [Paenibacillus sp. MMS20-IR301]WNS44932.1 metalloregulator ArsR/SmtB family transcription factor [Paenibacillus sp. MMS20-IR301]